MRTSATLDPIKGLTLRAPIPIRDICPLINLTYDNNNIALNPIVTGQFYFSYPLNGIFSASVAATGALSPTVLDASANQKYSVTTNIQTVVGGATPIVNLSQVRATAQYTSSFAFPVVQQSLGFLGSLQGLVTIRFNTEQQLWIILPFYKLRASSNSNFAFIQSQNENCRPD